jgi:hypothetical protein
MSHPPTQAMMSARPINRKIINPIFPKMAKAILEDVRYIFSINSDGFSPIYRTHSVTVIFPADRAQLPEGVDVPEDTHSFGEVAGIKYSCTAIHGRIELCDSGLEDKYVEVATEAELIAADLTDWCNQDMPRTGMGVPSFAGVWWGTKEVPTEKEIKNAQARLHAYYKALVAEADKFNETDEGKKNISDGMRRAAKTLRLERVWLYEAQPQNGCPACGGAIPAGVAVCKHCSAIVDEQKARKFFPERFKVQKAETAKV